MLKDAEADSPPMTLAGISSANGFVGCRAPPMVAAAATVGRLRVAAVDAAAAHVEQQGAFDGEPSVQPSVRQVCRRHHYNTHRATQHNVVSNVGARCQMPTNIAESMYVVGVPV
jgi:hypothetical protein